MARLENKNALVTSGGTGVGFGCVRRIAEEGARVTLAGFGIDPAVEARRFDTYRERYLAADNISQVN